MSSDPWLATDTVSTVEFGVYNKEQKNTSIGQIKKRQNSEIKDLRKKIVKMKEDR